MQPELYISYWTLIFLPLLNTCNMLRICFWRGIRGHQSFIFNSIVSFTVLHNNSLLTFTCIWTVLDFSVLWLDLYKTVKLWELFWFFFLLNLLVGYFSLRKIAAYVISVDHVFLQSSQEITLRSFLHWLNPFILVNVILRSCVPWKWYFIETLLKFLKIFLASSIFIHTFDLVLKLGEFPNRHWVQIWLKSDLVLIRRGLLIFLSNADAFHLLLLDNIDYWSHSVGVHIFNFEDTETRCNSKQVCWWNHV